MSISTAWSTASSPMWIWPGLQVRDSQAQKMCFLNRWILAFSGGKPAYMMWHSHVYQRKFYLRTWSFGPTGTIIGWWSMGRVFANIAGWWWKNMSQCATGCLEVGQLKFGRKTFWIVVNSTPWILGCEGYSLVSSALFTMIGRLSFIHPAAEQFAFVVYDGTHWVGSCCRRSPGEAQGEDWEAEERHARAKGGWAIGC